MELSQKITYLRKQKGWSQEQLATKLEVSRQAVYKWEAGISQPEIDKLKKIAKLFGVSFDELLDDEIEVDCKETYKEEEEVPSQPVYDTEGEAEESNNIKEETPPPRKQNGKKALIIGLIASIVATVATIVAGAILLVRFLFPLEFGTENTGSSLINDSQTDEEKPTDSSQPDAGQTDNSSPSQVTYYTVTFDTDGGTPVSSISVKAGERISADIYTEYDGYMLICWLRADTYEEWDFKKDKVTEDITLIALWADSEITATFYKNDGSGKRVELVVNDDGFLTLEDVFLDTTKTLMGWSSEPDGEVEYELGEEIFTFGDIELYAVWGEMLSEFCFEKIYSNGYSLVKYNGTDTVVEIPSTYLGYPVVSIEDCAFEGRYTVEVIKIPSGVTKINEYTFFDCIALKEIWVSETVTQIQPVAFTYCDVLENFVVSELNPSYCSIDGVLYNEARTNLVAYPRGRQDLEYYVPQGTHIIGERSFFGNTMLERVHLPNGVGVIRVSAFEGCASLVEIELGDRIDYVEGRAFYDCVRLQEVVFQYDLIAIGKEAFYNCTDLESVRILGNIGEISYRTFGDCARLTTLTIGGELTGRIDDNAFDGCDRFLGVEFISQDPQG